MNCPKCNEPEVRIMDSRNRLEEKRFIAAEDVWLEVVVKISTKRRRSRNGKSK